MKNILLVISTLIPLLFIISCRNSESEKNKDHVVHSYLYVWNGGNVDSLDAVTTENFELRINPDFAPVRGRDSLKAEILRTRNSFPDFTVNPKEFIFLSDTALVITWEISGTLNNPRNPAANGRGTKSSGFSIIFFHDNMLTGEWIAFSDLDWYKGLGL